MAEDDGWVEVELAPAGTPQPARRGRALFLLLLGPVAVALLVVALLAGGDSDPDASALLDEAAAQLEAAASFHVAGDVDLAAADGGEDGGSMRLLYGFEADVGGEDWHATYRIQGIEGLEDEVGEELQELETIRVGDRLFLRSDPEEEDWFAAEVEDPDDASPEELAAELEDMGASEQALFRLFLAVYGHAGDTLEPTAFSRVVTEATDPRDAEPREGGGHRLRVSLPPSERVAAVEPPVPTVDVVLDVDAEGRPEAAHVDVAEAGAALVLDLTWSAWDAAGPIEAPPDAEVYSDDDVGDDEVVAEHAEEGVPLADIEPGLLLAPAALPDGWTMVSATARQDDQRCTTVSLEYSGGDDGFASIDLQPVVCAHGTVLPGDPPLTGDGWAEAVVGDVHVSIDATMDEAELLALIASLAPTTAEALDAG